MNDIVNYAKYKSISNYLFTITIGVFFLTMCPHFGLIESMSMNNYILPVLWGVVSIVIFLFLPRVHAIVKVMKKENIIWDAAICAIAMIAVQIASGLFIYGFGKSPYDLSFMGIAFNIVTITPVILGKELIRGYYLGSHCTRPNKKAFVQITVLLILLNLNYSSMILIQDTKSLLIYFAQDFGPTVCKQMLLSYLALYGGAAASFVFIGIITAYQRIFPILPTYDWLPEGCIGIAIPLLSIILLMKKYERSTSYRWERPKKKENVVSLIGSSLFVIVFIWFVAGVFPIYPSVILTGSMKPLIDPGDIILIEKVKEESDVKALKKGDIIQFARDDILITHRIIEVMEDKYGNLTYRTKGDNNTTEDVQIVGPNDIKGSLEKVVPKLGMLKYYLMGGGDTPDDVEN